MIVGLAKIGLNRLETRKSIHRLQIYNKKSGNQNFFTIIFLMMNDFTYILICQRRLFCLSEVLEIAVATNLVDDFRDYTV